jgi:hypothetical protein
MKQKLQQIITLATELLSELPQEVKPTLTLELGKRYVTRDGSITEPLEAYTQRTSGGISGGPFRLAFTALLDTNQQYEETWCSNGCYYTDGPKSILDIVSEYVEEVNPTLTLEVGKRYVTRDGRVTGTMDFSNSNVFHGYRAVVGDNQHPSYWKSDGSWSDVGETSFDLVSEYEPGISVSFELPPQVTLAPAPLPIDCSLPDYLPPFPEAPEGKRWTYRGAGIHGLTPADGEWRHARSGERYWAEPPHVGAHSVGSASTHYIQLEDATRTH